MKKIIFSIALLALGSAGAYAKAVPVATAEKAAKTFINQQGVREAEVQLIKTYGETQNPAIYVFGLQNRPGFVIVSGEDAVTPILGYSTNNSFGVHNISPEVTYWMTGYQHQIEAVSRQKIDATAEVKQEWEALVSGATSEPTGAKPTTVTPILETTWNQLPYYNVLCPQTTPDPQVNPTGNAPTGCVATAMAQIMKHWENPTTGTGSHSYSTSTVGGTLSANFGATTYDWNNMPASLNGSSSQTEINAIATLMYHCGVAVEMDYTVGYSGAMVIDQPGYASAEGAYKTYFGYKSSIEGYTRASFTDSTWIKMLKFELDNGRPILYAGYGQAGGHAFDFDGYDNNDFFHINWGWGGLSDGYFTIDNLAPSALGTGGGGGNFNQGQHALVMIEPQNSNLPINPFTPDGDTANVSLVLDAPMNASNDTIVVNTPYSVSATIKNIGNDPFTQGAFALVAVNPTTQQVVQLAVEVATLPPGQTYTINYSTQSNPDLVVGEYLVVASYVTDLSNPVAEMVGPGSGLNPIPLVVVATAPSAIDEVQLAENFDIFPNPADDHIQINYKGQTQSNLESVALYNLLGQRLTQKTVTGNSCQLSLSEYAAGTYILRIQTKEGNFSKKINIR